ncbi:MAG: hypothetical protein OK457_03410 [Thaumarchaeota archaeon]|nr:hypothetical protein [Nitrososphaerota archaeon]
MNHEFVAQTRDEDDAERIMLTPKGIESYHRFVDWVKETLDGVKI